MSDDLDDLLRAAMKTLDDQVPSGYFEGLPNRALARLEDSSMQTTGTSQDSSATGVPPQDREEDSGLHDIRSMASSTKLRMSSRRIGTSPPIDEDVLASSSAGWKAVALPAPAKMVSLPELSELPAASEVARLDKLSKQERASAKKIAKAAVAVSTSVATPIAPSASIAPEPVAVTPIVGARLAQQQKSKAGLVAVIGLGLAAAAGAAFYVMNEQRQPDAPALASVEPPPAAVNAGIVAEPIEEAVAPAAAPEPEPVAALEIATGADAADEPDDATGRAERIAKPSKSERRKGAAKDANEPDTKTAEPKPVKPVAADPAAKKPGDGEPSFDDLLKEAGVSDKKVVKPKLDKKSLSSSDIKSGMGSIAGKAQACFNGTQGTAKVKLTVLPSGQVEKVAVSGVFGGTPVGACVERAVKGATFPAWDGGPQTFGYSYLLAE